jgi:hypothetical protein
MEDGRDPLPAWYDDDTDAQGRLLCPRPELTFTLAARQRASARMMPWGLTPCVRHRMSRKQQRDGCRHAALCLHQLPPPPGGLV